MRNKHMAKQESAVEPIEIVEPPVIAHDEFEQEAFALIRIGTRDELDKALVAVEARLEFVDKLRTFTLRRTRATDWSIQSDARKGTKRTYLGESGVQRFRAAFGMYEGKMQSDGSTISDLSSYTVDSAGARRDRTSAKFFEPPISFIWFEGTVGSKLLNVEAWFQGAVKVEEGFWSKDDIHNFYKKAQANFIGRAFRKLLGLENISLDELKTAGINIDDIPSIDRVTTEKAASADAVELHKMLLALNEGNPKKAEDYLFAMTNSDKYKGKRTASSLTDNQMKWILPKVRSEHDAKFPEKAAERTAAVAEQSTQTSAQSSSESNTKFQQSVAGVAKTITEADYAAVCAEYAIQDIAEIAVDKRNAFLLSLVSRRKK